MNSYELFPGIEYRPMQKQELRDFVHDIQRMGMTEFRKNRLLQAVGPFCNGFAIKWCLRYGVDDIREFSGAAWQAIENAVNGFSQAHESSFLLYLAFHIRAQYNAVVFANYTAIRFYGDKHPIKFESLDRPISDGEGATLMDIIGDDSALEKTERKDQRRLIAHLFNKAKLNDLQREILLQNFGLGGVEYDLEIIGNANGHTKEWARMKIKNALKKLREKAGIRQDGKTGKKEKPIHANTGSAESGRKDNAIKCAQALRVLQACY